MLDHISLRVSDLDRSKRFYLQALAPLGFALFWESGETVAFSVGGKPEFGIATGDAVAPTHVAFRTDRPTVDAFHAAALEAGGTDNGGPGIRTRYHKHYYAAFVRDPDGHNIEAVCHDPP